MCCPAIKAKFESQKVGPVLIFSRLKPLQEINKKKNPE